MDSKQEKRVLGLDIIRTIAILFVISVHFFRSTGFYTKVMISGEVSFVILAMRWLFYTCVPLFMLLTGFLNRKKEVSKKYFKGISKILESYFFIAIICILARVYIFNEKRRKLYWIVSIFNFTADGYAWYIEMYIGLFLLIPFLNILFNSLKEKKHKQYLILILIFMTSISPTINCLNLLGQRIDIVPDFWTQLYPITYYFIGSYIAEFKLKIPKKRIMIELFFVLMCQSIIYFFVSRGNLFSWTYFNGYNNLFSLIIAALIFLLFYDLDIKIKPVKKVISSISIVSLDMFLLSYIVDLKVYPYVLEYIKRPIDYLKYFLPTVICVFTICYILALAKKILFDLLIHKKKKSMLRSY